GRIGCRVTFLIDMSNGKRQAVCAPNEVDTLSLTAKVQRRDSSSRRERKLIPSWRWQETHDGPQQPQRFRDLSVRRSAWQFPGAICISSVHTRLLVTGNGLVTHKTTGALPSAFLSTCRI